MTSREELKKEGDEKEANVHAVDVGISGEDELVVAESVETVFDVQRMLEEIEILRSRKRFCG